MSSTLQKAKYFLLLLMDKKTSKEQARALLETATPDQVNSITEIIHNLLFGELPLNKNIKETLKKRRKSLTKISDKTKSVRSRSCLVQQHSRLVYDTVLQVKTILTKVLSQ